MQRLRFGSEPFDPHAISGQVTLTVGLDGGPVVNVFANVTRTLADGGTEPDLDAGVALNGVPLGPAQLFDQSADQPTLLTWTAPSFPGATPLGQQTLSVIDSNPPANVSFNCPAAISFLSPLPGAAVDRSAPVELQWTPGGSLQFDQILSFQAAQADGGFVVGVALIEPGATSVQFTLPPQTPAGARVRFDLIVAGDSPDPNSSCQSQPMLNVVFP